MSPEYLLISIILQSPGQLEIRIRDLKIAHSNSSKCQPQRSSLSRYHPHLESFAFGISVIIARYLPDGGPPKITVSLYRHGF